MKTGLPLMTAPWLPQGAGARLRWWNSTALRRGRTLLHVAHRVRHGFADLSFNAMAAIMSEVLDKPVRFQRIPIRTFGSTLLGAGRSEPMAQAMVDMLAKNKGLDNHDPRTPQSTTPTSFRKWCEGVLKPAMLR